METGIIFVLGVLLGSFLNVVIYRLPRGESLIFPPSHCPQCDHKIRFRENIPVFSYIFLQGKCAACKNRIPIRYFIVELLVPLLLSSLFIYLGPTWDFVKNAVLILILVPVSFIDIDHKLILNKITLPGMVAGFLLSIWTQPDVFYKPLLGIIAGGGVLWLIAIIGQFIYRQESMGGGDIKFGAMIGAFMDAESIIFALFAAFFIASLFVTTLMLIGILNRRSTIPFGPFISLGTFVTICYKNHIILAYLHWIGYQGT